MGTASSTGSGRTASQTCPGGGDGDIRQVRTLLQYHVPRGTQPVGRAPAGIRGPTTLHAPRHAAAIHPPWGSLPPPVPGARRACSAREQLHVLTKVMRVILVGATV